MALITVFVLLALTAAALLYGLTAVVWRRPSGHVLAWRVLGAASLLLVLLVAFWSR